MKNYFLELKKAVDTKYEEINKDKLKKYNSFKSKNKQFNTYKELEKHCYELLNVFSNSDISEEDLKKYKARVIRQYEEKKNDVTFGVFIENHSNFYYLNVLIVDKEKTFTILILKDKDLTNKIITEFDSIKNAIINKDINDLSYDLLKMIS